MAASAIWKRYDTYPPLAAVLSDTNGAIALTSASSVKAVWQSTTPPTQITGTGPMTIASAAGGYVTYGWQGSDLGYADTYNLEFEIHWQTGTIETVPNDGYATFKVEPDLENT